MAEPTVIVADDDAGIRTVISRALSRHGYRVQATGTAATLWRWIEDDTGDVAILDVVLPDENTLDLLPQIRQRRPALPVIMMSAQNTLLTAVRATERGAFDYLPKPFDLGHLVTMVKRALALPHTTEFVHEEPNRIQEQLPIIGRSPAMQEIYRVIARLVGTDLTVMINGESGTGKELVAQAIHDYGKRRGGPFVAVNMAAIPRELIESELFGHEKGSFTGARSVGSSRPRAAPCSSTRSATCRSRRRPGCYVSCNPASSCRSGGGCRSGRICASWPPPTGTCVSW
jgi:two-component system nitrogen regulation response regulator GlnG